MQKVPIYERPTSKTNWNKALVNFNISGTLAYTHTQPNTLSHTHTQPNTLPHTYTTETETETDTRLSELPDSNVQ